jgi:hypothetical protein
MAGIGIVGQALAPFDRLDAPREDRDAVEALLAVPDRLVARRLDIGDREGLVAGLDLLQQGDVGRLLLEPFDQAGETGLDPVDVERRDLNGVRG